MTDWEWRIGVLHGFGECAWQEHDGKVRRVTMLVAAPQGRVGLVPALAPRLSELGAATEYPADRLVIASSPPLRELVDDLNKAWEGSGKIIAPPSGMMFRRLRGDGPC